MVLKMTNCKNCTKNKECKYSHIENSCSNCLNDMKYFMEDEVDPCIDCNDNKNFVYYGDPNNDG